MTSKRNAAAAQLRGLLVVLDNRAKQPAGKVLEAARQVATDALRILQEPDPTTQRVLFVIAAIKQSTEVKTYQRNGKSVTLTRITEPDLYHWAMEQVHRLAAELAA